MTSLESFKETREKMDALRKEMRDLAEQAFKEGAESLFDKWGDKLERFAWIQYTPYFNDGDPCVFGVNWDYVDVNDEEDCHLYTYEGHDESQNKTEDYIASEITEFLSAIGEESLESVFGDHAKITVYRDRIEVDEFEHE